MEACGEFLVWLFFAFLIRQAIISTADFKEEKEEKENE